MPKEINLVLDVFFNEMVSQEATKNEVHFTRQQIIDSLQSSSPDLTDDKVNELIGHCIARELIEHTDMSGDSFKITYSGLSKVDEMGE